MCGFVAATNIASISGYNEWACDTTGHTTTDPCTGPWTGITCTGTDVTYMNVNSKGVTGSIPVEVGQLSALTDMRLYSNSITGSIPVEVGQLSALIVMSLASNSITGSIPVEMGQLSALTWMALQGNSITGKHCICKVNGVYGMCVLIDVCALYVYRNRCVHGMCL
jgi:hypothetical protein